MPTPTSYPVFISKRLLSRGFIDLSGNEITDIESGSFCGTPSARTLFLGGNRLRNITQGMFSCLSKLDVLHLDHNLIHTIEDYSFKPLIDLRNLRISYNYLSILRKGTFKGTGRNLQRLELQHNMIDTIEAATFRFMRSLTVLSLGYNKLKSFEEGFFSRLGINNYNDRFSVCVYLDNNEISRIKKNSFHRVVRLGALSLDNNSLSAFNWKIFGEKADGLRRKVQQAVSLTGNPHLCSRKICWIAHCLEKSPYCGVNCSSLGVTQSLC